MTYVLPSLPTLAVIRALLRPGDVLIVSDLTITRG